MSIPVISLSDERFANDRHATIRELRKQHWHAETPEGHILFLNQDDALEVFRCEKFRFTFNYIDSGNSPYLAKAIEHELLNMHGDHHARLSRLLKRALRDRVIDGLQQHIDAIVSDLLEALPACTHFDFCRDFANPLPARVLGPMFGLPYEEVDGLDEWIRIGGRKLDALQSGVDIKLVEDANRQLHNYLRELIRSRREAPGNDLFSEMMLAEIDGDQMSEDELVFLAAELAAAGVDTTRAQLPLILLALLQHPTEWQKLDDNPALSAKAVDEGMRYAPLPWAIPHEATHTHKYKGLSINSGDLVFILVPAVNRDPAAMQNPECFNISRARARHFSFGAGIHVCPGIRLARMEMAGALQQVIQRYPHLKLAGEPEWEPGQRDRTLRSLIVKTN